MDAELFYLWVDKLFIPKTAHLPKPIILILDSHGSHIDVKMIDLLKAYRIELFCLPPHTTNILQPLDVSVFHPLKTSFSNVTDLIKLASIVTKSSVTVSKKSFTPLFKEAYEKALSVSNIKNGFRKCGVYPFDPEAIDKKRLIPSLVSTNATITQANKIATTLINVTATAPSNLITTVSVKKNATKSSNGISTAQVNKTAITSSTNVTATTQAKETATTYVNSVSLNNIENLFMPNDLHIISSFDDNDEMLQDTVVPESPSSEVYEFDNFLTEVAEHTHIRNITTPPALSLVQTQDYPPPTSLPGTVATPDLSPNSIMHRVSPLVSSGKIPASLLSSFIIPDSTRVKREKNTRIVTKARVLTSDEQIRLLKDRVEAKNAEEERKKRKKAERERKKLEKEKFEKEKEARNEQRKKDKERKIVQKKRKAEGLKLQIPAKKKGTLCAKCCAMLESRSGEEFSPPTQVQAIISKNDEIASASTTSRKSSRRKKTPLRYVELTES